MPRLPEIFERDQVPENQRVHFDSIIASRKRISAPYQFLLHAPDMAGRVAHTVGYSLFQTSLDPRVKEVAICVVAREMDCLYEWAVHEDAARQAGAGEEITNAIRNGTPPQGVPEEDAAIVRYVQELLRKPHRAKDETFSTLRNRLGNEHMAELTAIIGAYVMLACCLNAFEVATPPGHPVLPT